MASGRELALVLEVATLGSNASVCASTDIEKSSVDHGRINPCNDLSDVVLQVIQGGRPGVVDQRLDVTPQEEVQWVEVG